MKIFKYTLNIYVYYIQGLICMNLITWMSQLQSPGIHFPLVLLHNQGYPKVCPNLLNLLNAGDPFAGISSLSFYSLFSPTRDLIALI
jgi:hypothetical protein